MCTHKGGLRVCVYECVCVKGVGVLGFWGLMLRPFSLDFQYHPATVHIWSYAVEFNV